MDLDFRAGAASRPAGDQRADTRHAPRSRRRALRGGHPHEHRGRAGRPLRLDPEARAAS
ncbi:MAG: hypothetical protein MZW92_15325 [Comamonadaceae bacterium]|nr:hypothetical protein [Comamonadaceae bacterium]